MAKMIFKTWYSARNESKDVIVPAPAIIGNARGTIEAVSGASLLKIDIPSIISRARKKMIKEPATANELISIPIRFSISSPTNKNPTIIIAAIIEAFSDWMCPTFSLSDMTKGIFPIISITANKTKLAVKISFASITLIFFANLNQIF